MASMPMNCCNKPIAKYSEAFAHNRIRLYKDDDASVQSADGDA
jgi:hypothetical protein